MLSGKRVVIIGGSSGMGLAAAKKFAEQGAHVCITGRSQAKLEEAKKAIGGSPSSVSIYAFDASVEKNTKDFFAALQGDIDHLILSGAGRVAWGPLANLEAQTVRTAMDEKFMMFFNAVKYALPKLSKSGSITFTAGAAARAALPGTSGVSAVNSAIIGFARTLAKELAPIRVNTIRCIFVKYKIQNIFCADPKAK